jgi:predicted PurR-regulated permease PerM
MEARTHWWRTGAVAGSGHMTSRAFDGGRSTPPRLGNTAAVLRATLIVVGVLAALYLVYLLRRPIAWLAIAAFVALALAPPVRVLSRWMRRGFAIAIVYIGLLLVPIGLGLVVVPPVVTQVNHFVDDAPRYAADVRDFIEHNRTLRRLQEEYDIGGQLQEKAGELPERFGSAASLLAGLGLGLLNSLFAVVTILVLAAFMLASGPRWRDEALKILPAERAAAWRRVSDDIAGAVGNYGGGAIAQAVIAGTSSYVVMLILGIPFSGPLAVLIGVLDLIPLIGATIGAVLVGIVSVFVGFPVATIIWAVWAIVYQQAENNIIQPRIQARAVDVQPFVVLVAVLFGGVLFGILGALMAAPAVASVQIVIRELLRHRRALRTDAERGERPEVHDPTTNKRPREVRAYSQDRARCDARASDDAPTPSPGTHRNADLTI